MVGRVIISLATVPNGDRAVGRLLNFSLRMTAI